MSEFSQSELKKLERELIKLIRKYRGKNVKITSLIEDRIKEVIENKVRS